MKKYASILCIFGMVYILFLSCTKPTVAQIDFSVSLISDTAKIQRYIIPGTPSISTRARFFPLKINIRATEAAIKLYPRAKIFLKYIMLDKNGNELRDVFLYQKLFAPSSGLFFNQFFNPVAANLNQLLFSQKLFSSFLDTLTYNIVRTGNDTLSTEPYKIVFTFIVTDSTTMESIPIINSNKEAKRKIEIIINPKNPNQASYILTYNKFFLYSSEKTIQKKVKIYFIGNQDYQLLNNKYLNIVG